MYTCIYFSFSTLSVASFCFVRFVGPLWGSSAWPVARGAPMRLQQVNGPAPKMKLVQVSDMQATQLGQAHHHCTDVVY